MWQKFLHKFLRLPYLLNTKELRAPSKPDVTIIMIHGIGSSLDMWQPIVKKLPGGVRVIAIDLLGFGKSPKPSWNVYDVHSQANSVAATLFNMKITGPVVLVGHSLGSLVAIEFAKRYPLMTKSLVLVSPPLYQPNRHIKRFDFHPEEVLRRMYDLMLNNPHTTDRILRLAGKYYLINPGFHPENVDVMAYLTSLETSIINQKSYQDILKIKRPIHILTGKLDALVIEDTIKQVAEQRQNVNWKSVLGGHEVVGRVKTSLISFINTAIDEAVERSKNPSI